MDEGFGCQFAGGAGWDRPSRANPDRDVVASRVSQRSPSEGLQVAEPVVSAGAPVPRKVLHVTWRLSDSGGIAIVIRNIIRHHDAAAIDLHVAVGRTGPGDDLAAVADRCTVHVLSSTFGRGSRLRAQVLMLWAVAKTVRREEPAVVHCHSGTAWWTSVARVLSPRREWLLEVHDAPGNGRHGRAVEWFEGWLCRRARYRPICHSSSVAEEVRRRWRISTDRTTVFPLGIDTALHDNVGRRATARRQLGVADATFVVLGVGRLVASKGFDTWLHVATRLKSRTDRPCKFFIASDGPDASKLHALAHDLGLDDDVIFTGMLAQEDLLSLQAAADVFLSTSTYEGFGLAVVEAMASGVPPVVSDVGGHRDLVDVGVTGWICSEMDEYVGHLVALAERPLLGLQMGAAAKVRAYARFGRQAFSEEFDRVYLKTVSY